MPALSRGRTDRRRPSSAALLLWLAVVGDGRRGGVHHADLRRARLRRQWPRPGSRVVRRPAARLSVLRRFRRHQCGVCRRVLPTEQGNVTVMRVCACVRRGISWQDGPTLTDI